MQIHAGKEREFNINGGKDSEGNGVALDVSGATVVSSDPAAVEVVQVDAGKYIVRDPVGAGTGSATVTAEVPGIPPFSELFENVAGDAVTIDVSVGDERDRT